SPPSKTHQPPSPDSSTKKSWRRRIDFVTLISVFPPSSPLLLGGTVGEETGGRDFRILIRRRGRWDLGNPKAMAVIDSDSSSDSAIARFNSGDIPALDMGYSIWGF
ncbi:unnamed protein product, partial [Linum tenue]